MDAGSLLSIISLALDTWSCQSPTVFCFVTEGPPRLGGSLASPRQQRKIVCVIKWRYYRFTHTPSEYVFLLHFSLVPICYCAVLHRLGSHLFLLLARPMMAGLKLKREDRARREVFWLTALTWVFMVRLSALIFTLGALCALHTAPQRLQRSPVPS